MTKNELRRQLRARRDDFVSGLSLAHRCCHYVQMAERIMARSEGAKTLACYLAVGSEVDGCSILAAAQARGLTLALPWLSDREAPMQFRQWMIGDPLFGGPFGIKQPGANAPVVSPDCIVAPLVGFDQALARLGQGAGFYDRAFAAHPQARRFGLAWSVQQVSSLPTDPWDIPLHAVLTENGWVEPGGASLDAAVPLQGAA